MGVGVLIGLEEVVFWRLIVLEEVAYENVDFRLA